MVLKTKIEPIARDLQIIVDKTLAPDAQKEAIANFAQDQFEAADATNKRVLGRIAPHTTTVDGHEGAPFDSINPDGGRIIIEWELMTDVLQWIGQALRDRSPVQSGRYRDSHTILADGNEVELGDNIPQAEEYTFVNTQPYARKIEIGTTKAGRAFVLQVPNRIYERVAKDAKSRFGNIARIRYDFVSLNGGALGKWAGGASAKRLAAKHRRRTKIHEWLTRQPAIIVSNLGGLRNASGLS